MKLTMLVLCLGASLIPFGAVLAADDDIEKRVEHGYADSGGVKIHYAALGDKKNPLIVMIHGFPDFWYSWRDQMAALSSDYYVVAIDQRGYNLSDKPKGVEKLIILNLPHLRGLSRELANNPQQQKNSQYARDFQQPDAHTKVTAEGLTFWVKDPEVKKKYIEAFKRSDLEAMLNYYKRNYPREPYKEDASPVVKVKMPVLMIHGLGDWALLPGALNNTWEWLESDLTLVTIPKAGHFLQQDASDMVTRSIKMWLKR